MLDNFTKIRKEDLLRNILFGSNLSKMFNAIMVTDNNPNIEVATYEKKGIVLTRTIVNKKYKLEPHTLNVKSNEASCTAISDSMGSKTIHINETLTQVFDDNICYNMLMFLGKYDREMDYKFFFKNWIKKKLKKRTPDTLAQYLINKSDDMSWMIINPKVLNIIKDTKFFTPCAQTGSCLRQAGKLELDNFSIDVYVSCELTTQVYIGNYNSLSLIINREVTQNKIETKEGFDSFRVSIHYTFDNTGDIKSFNII